MTAQSNTLRSGAALAAVSGEVGRLLTIFEGAGALRVEPEVLQDAETLLDLYGEDIRARAFVTHDGTRELMLRPDFTVPVVQRHMAMGQEPARYAYAGPVWRRQRAAGALREFIQTGFELFDGRDPAAADAEVFALVSDALSGLGVSASIGDMGLLLAAVDALTTTPARKAALRRHLWRPARFQRLLDRYATPSPLRPALAGDETPENLVTAAGRPLGTRSVEEVAARVTRLRQEAETPPLTPQDVALVQGLLTLAAPASQALAAVQTLAGQHPAMAPAIDRLDRRLQALSQRGIDLAELPFEGSYGRTTLEYYDGFVFGFYQPDQPELPTVASGGRYDALTTVLGGGAGVPAVGAIIRPERVLAAREGATC